MKVSDGTGRVDCLSLGLLLPEGRLVDRHIYALGSKGVIEPFDPELVNPASLDVRIGYHIYEEDEDGRLHKRNIQDRSIEAPLLIAPNEAVLAETLEVFNFPEDVEGVFNLKSSRGRELWDHCLAGYIDPGFHNSRLTLELKNAGRFGYKAIYPGMLIGQIRFTKVPLPDKSYRQTGRYNGDLTVTPSKG